MDTLMKAIQFEVENLLQETKVSVDRTLGIGISLPGTVNEETKLLKIAPNIGIKNIDFTQYEPFFQFPLFVENDANLAAMAELTLGIAKTMRDLVYIYVLPIGIGCGIVVEGEICRGKNKRAGEVSHMTVASYGKQCLCGRRDCWELYASANVLLTMYREKTGKNIHTIEDFFASLEKYEPAATEVFDTYLEYLALGIQNIMLIQDPHYIIIGGVLSRFEKFFLEPLQEKIFATNSFYTNNDVTIMWSLLKEDGPILGASLLPFERIFFSP
jgi:predicted NBD/HSP70 family sugar kinase